MAELRRQGLPFAEVGARCGLSERTARRYAGKVEPRLRLPQANPEPEADPQALRERFTSELLVILYRDTRLRSLTMKWVATGPDSAKAVYGGPPSIFFLNEAERLLREELDRLGRLALKFLAREQQSQHRFLREVVGNLYWDYVGYHEFMQKFPDSTGEDWRPARERPRIEVEEDDL